MRRWSGLWPVSAAYDIDDAQDQIAGDEAGIDELPVNRADACVGEVVKPGKAVPGEVEGHVPAVAVEIAAGLAKRVGSEGWHIAG